MKELNCGIIRDLLPLYIDCSCGCESAEAVEAHLRCCQDCAALHKSMTAPLPATLADEERENIASVYRVLGGAVWLLMAVVISLYSFLVNGGGAWMGDPGLMRNFIATLVFLGFWLGFSVFNRRSRGMVCCGLVISALLFLSALGGVLWGQWKISTLLMLLSPLTGVPLYGLRMFWGWNETYLAGLLFAAVLLVINIVSLCLMKKRPKR